MSQHKDTTIWAFVERAYKRSRHSDLYFEECLPKSLTPREREIARAAFAVGRVSYANNCEEARDMLLESGLV